MYYFNEIGTRMYIRNVIIYNNNKKRFIVVVSEYLTFHLYVLLLYYIIYTHTVVFCDNILFSINFANNAVYSLKRCLLFRAILFVF
jgi:hypothetical protein